MWILITGPSITSAAITSRTGLHSPDLMHSSSWASRKLDITNSGMVFSLSCFIIHGRQMILSCKLTNFDVSISWQWKKPAEVSSRILWCATDMNNQPFPAFLVNAFLVFYVAIWVLAPCVGVISLLFDFSFFDTSNVHMYHELNALLYWIYASNFWLAIFLTAFICMWKPHLPTTG